MRVLAIETATEACSIALFNAGQLVANRHETIGRGHAERLVPMIRNLPSHGRADEIRVSLGPGSFTGTRIGLAAARALALAWNAKVFGFPTLALVAVGAAEKSSRAPVDVAMPTPDGGHVLALLAHPNVASKEDIIRRYDHEVRGGTVVRPYVGPEADGPADAAVLKPLGTSGTKAVVLSNGICPAVGRHDPYAMALLAMDEAVRNLVAVGGDPLTRFAVPCPRGARLCVRDRPARPLHAYARAIARVIRA